MPLAWNCAASWSSACWPSFPKSSSSAGEGDRYGCSPRKRRVRSTRSKYARSALPSAVEIAMWTRKHSPIRTKLTHGIRRTSLFSRAIGRTSMAG
jgi:hypothetical protein